jgi:2-polyprenyl-3-methyl-5-hydroxy-6-metoxy-1,4-benzoquinol methylase
MNKNDQSFTEGSFLCTHLIRPTWDIVTPECQSIAKHHSGSFRVKSGILFAGKPVSLQPGKIQSMSFLNRVFYEIFYFRKPPWDTGISPPELMEFISSHPAGRALDLGCGTGTNAITLAQHGWQTTGVDFVGKAVRTARRKAHQAGVEVDFRQGDIERISGIRGPFELILDIGCFHSLTEDGKITYVRNLELLLARNGTYLMYAFFKEPGSSGPGLVEKDLDLFSDHLQLTERRDGFERGERPSVWLTYRKV